jgi:hypothetical protein
VSRNATYPLCITGSPTDEATRATSVELSCFDENRSIDVAQASSVCEIVFVIGVATKHDTIVPRQIDHAQCSKDTQEFPMAVTVFIRYQLDPFKRADFEEYSKRWLSIIPRCGGDLIGYFMPHEGTNNIAFALISFETLATYEAYRARLRCDAEGGANFNFAEEQKFILAEERAFLRKVVA